MIDFYTWPTPNGRKIAIMLEECGLAYARHAVDISNNEQFANSFVRISPNSKIPAIVDHDTPEGPISIFESAAILIYLAEKTGRFLAAAGTQRAKALQWLAWQVAGVGPTLGQANHFNSGAGIPVTYAVVTFSNLRRRLPIVRAALEEEVYSADLASGHDSQRCIAKDINVWRP